MQSVREPKDCNEKHGIKNGSSWRRSRARMQSQSLVILSIYWKWREEVMVEYGIVVVIQGEGIKTLVFDDFVSMRRGLKDVL